MLKGLIIQASHTEALEAALTADGLPWKKIPGGSEKALLEAARGLGEPKEVLCLVETDADEKIARSAGFFCVGYLNPERPEEKLSGCRILLEGFEEIDRKFLTQVHTRALGLPVTIAETERLILREMSLADLEELNALCRRNGYAPMEETEAKAYIDYMYGLYQCGMWLVVEKKSGKLIGRCGYGVADYLGFSELDLGYLTDAAYRRQGYAEEACKASLAYGDQTLELPQVSAYVEEENAASRSLLVKLGFDSRQCFDYDGKRFWRYVRDRKQNTDQNG